MQTAKLAPGSVLWLWTLTWMDYIIQCYRLYLIRDVYVVNYPLLKVGSQSWVYAHEINAQGNCSVQFQVLDSWTNASTSKFIGLSETDGRSIQNTEHFQWSSLN